MATSPVINELLVRADVAQAPHGQRGERVATLMAATGKSRATVYRHINKATVRAPRKRRSDAGAVALTRDEAALVAALVRESARKNEKRLMTVARALEVLRANGEVRAERVDPATGEVRPLSAAAVTRALHQYGMHPDQLAQPSVARELRSLHPNHVWQIDASLCVLYYLNSQDSRERGLQVMPAAQFNKNKPANLARIERRRVWSYEVTDHYSGAVFVTYVWDAESATNISESFIAAMQPRGEAPFYGVPQILMMDMGSANTSGMFKNLLRRLQVQPYAHAPENARATGQVEKARDIIERNFESRLRLRPVDSLDELNALAVKWAAHFNATAIHRRHGRTRAEMWMRITEAQLRLAPSVDLCRTLLTHRPEERKVNQYCRVEFGGAQYDVSAVPNVMVGEKVLVAISPWQQDAVLVIETDAEGNEHPIVAPLVAKDDAGFSTGAHSNVIGEQWRAPAQTQADRHRAELDLLATGASSAEDAAARRKAKAPLFDGRIDPFKSIDEAQLPAFLPRRGTVVTPAFAPPARAVPTLTWFEAARVLSGPAYLGKPLLPAQLALLRQLHPEGVPEDQLQDLATRLAARGALRVVGSDQP